MHGIIVVCLLAFGLIDCAPKSSTTFDQKQTGEYNIQLHLKDFQIIAVVGDDSFGSIGGDYDYNYDYNDFTIKPVTPPTTASPVTTKKPDNVTETTTKKINVEIVNATVQPVLNATTTTSKPSNASHSEALIKPHILNGQIPVYIQDYILNDNAHLAVKDDKKKVENIAIVPVEDIANSGEQDAQNLGEIMHYRRCAQGYSRDKRGRCRKVRRPPQIPLDITRFATNFASRFRQGDDHIVDSNRRV